MLLLNSVWVQVFVSAKTLPRKPCNSNLDTSSYNTEEVLREAINALKNDSRFLSITIQPEHYDEKTPVMQPVSPIISPIKLI